MAWLYSKDQRFLGAHSRSKIVKLGDLHLLLSAIETAKGARLISERDELKGPTPVYELYKGSVD